MGGWHATVTDMTGDAGSKQWNICGDCQHGPEGACRVPRALGIIESLLGLISTGLDGFAVGGKIHLRCGGYQRAPDGVGQ